MHDKPAIIISLHQDIAYEVDKQIEKAVKLGYHSITVSPVHWKYDREFEEEPRKTKHGQFSRPDLVLPSSQWLGQTICRLNSMVDLDSPTDHVRRHGEQVIRQELSFAEHLVQNGYILLPLKSGNCVNLARTVTSVPVKEMLLLEVPMVNPKLAQRMWRTDRTDDRKDGEVVEETWHWWNSFRTYADYNPTIKLALEFSADIPAKPEVYRWLGEPVDCIILPSTLFITNASNYPVLSRAHQELLVLFYRTFECHFIVKANPSDGRLANYADYIKHILRTNYVKDPMQGYDDLLENPLQPLHDNLDNFTYEIFEKDPVKYILYQNAIEQALRDRVPDDVVTTKKSIIMVVGGGRGPLVRAALNASVKSKRLVKIYVIEKNPNAIVTLSALIKTIWKGRDVELIATDMREFHPPEKADILVSELLGSFGDNELSPECLDGAQEHLKPDGISIPCKSTSYVNPCLATKLHNQIRALEKCPHTKDRIASSRNMESSYVAYQRNVYHIANPQAVFEFEHPNRATAIDNNRFKTLHFKASLDCVMNGFTGYFDTVLYKDIVLSIHPFTHTHGMASWFSLFFPLTEPIQIRKDEEIIVNFWRCVSSHKVWYEWCITAPKLTHVHNVQGRGQSIWK